MGTGPTWNRTNTLTTAAVVALPTILLASPPHPLTAQHPTSYHLNTLAVLGGGPTWTEPPFYRVFDAILRSPWNESPLHSAGDASGLDAAPKSSHCHENIT